MILAEKCIDCGECIRTCPNHAKVAVADEMSCLKKFTKTIALPAPSLFGQFPGNSVSVEQICQAIKLAGFDEVFLVAEAADQISVATWLYAEEHRLRPLISSSCPAIVQLIQVRFSELIPNLIKLESPVEVAAKLAKEEVCRLYDLPPEEVGAVFLSPCAAKVTELKGPEGQPGAYVDAVIPINVVYPHLVRNLGQVIDPDLRITASFAGFSWARQGGEEEFMQDFVHVSVSGIHQALDVLADVEMGKFAGVDFLEVQACPGGCVGGPLTVVNATLAKTQLEGVLSRSRIRERPQEEDLHRIQRRYRKGLYHLTREIQPRPAMQLDEDLTQAARKMTVMERVGASLPGLDCGSCGSPSCAALAEDIAQGLATESDCIFKLKEGIQELAEELLVLIKQVPSSMPPETAAAMEGGVINHKTGDGSEGPCN